MSAGVLRYRPTDHSKEKKVRSECAKLLLL